MRPIELLLTDVRSSSFRVLSSLLLGLFLAVFLAPAAPMEAQSLKAESVHAESLKDDSSMPGEPGQQLEGAELEQAISAVDDLARRNDMQEGEPFQIVDEGALPYPRQNRTSYALSIGGGKGALVSPSWVLSASHCVTSRDQAARNVKVKYRDNQGKNRSSKGVDVFRHPWKDLVLVRLEEPINASFRTPVILLRDPFKPAHGTIRIKKVSAPKTTYWNIPARVSSRNKDRFYVSPSMRQGPAGTSGSPWLINTLAVGDVAVGVTHGSGRAPQIGSYSRWINETVNANSDEMLWWATLEQVLRGRPAAQISLPFLSFE